MRGLRCKKQGRANKIGITPAYAGTTQINDSGQTVPLWITPAYAGTTNIVVGPPASQEDHPRVCGDYLFFPLVKSGRLGSPPRMRGLPVEQLCIWSTDGITPAYAGTTF